MAEYPEPVFPPEIEEIIFSLCAQSDLSNSRNLIFVAKRVYTWIGAQLYKIAIFNSDMPTGVPRFHPDLLEVHGRHVRHIMFWLGTYPYDRATCLSRCPNVVDVALWEHDTIYDKKLMDQLLGLHLTHLSFDVTLLHAAITKEFPSTTASFLSITHLEPIGLDITLTAEEIKQCFPSVTHMIVDGGQGLSAQSILHCWGDQLKVLIWFEEASAYPEIAPNNVHDLPNDPRVVLIDQKRDYVNEWNERARDGPKSIWKEAETIIECRRDAARGSSGSR
ncbi:hypothetical protein BDN72DRAFT_846542 [Pluteus cervinus]|uniref:Uncharacterized protein n=1 Tax=Pluteus cervinus TaxID=181527 RepID=A0ACD3AFY6_9AGAR|nr:hypothetical protein BDN72DRAFT_846542 [Pluteus cervinus]